MAPFRPLCTDFRAVKKRFEMLPKHEVWVQWIGSGAFVAKNFEQLRLENLCVNGTSSASLTPTFGQ
jgi:hypothetical protein